MHLINNDLEHILLHVTDLKAEFQNSRIFITGGTGFFGRWLLESFCWMNKVLELGAMAEILVRPQHDFHFPWPKFDDERCLRIHRGDIRDFDFPKGAFTHVIHAAASGSPGLDGVSPLETFETVVEGTRRTLDFAVAREAKKFLFVSSGAVYGAQPPEILKIPESYVGSPQFSDSRFAYSEAKRVGELLCFYYAKSERLQTKIARCFGFMGPYIPLDRGFAIGNFVQSCLRKQPIEISGDGTNHRSYLYAADLAIWLWRILAQGKESYPYNVGCEESHSVLEIAESVRAAFNMPGLLINVARKPDANAPIERYSPSTARAERELGLKSWISFQDGIRKTVDFYRRVRQN